MKWEIFNGIEFSTATAHHPRRIDHGLEMKTDSSSKLETDLVDLAEIFALRLPVQVQAVVTQTVQGATHL